MFEKASKKLGLSRAVLQGDASKNKDKMSAKDVEKLLKEGAYQVSPRTFLMNSFFFPQKICLMCVWLCVLFGLEL